MRSCDPQEVPRLQSGGAFYAPRRIRTAPSWMPFFTHLQLGLLCRDERVARVCELLAARRVKSSLHLYKETTSIEATANSEAEQQLAVALEHATHLELGR